MVFEAPRVSYGGMPYLKITVGWSLKRQEWAMVVCRTSRICTSTFYSTLPGASSTASATGTFCTTETF